MPLLSHLLLNLLDILLLISEQLCPLSLIDHQLAIRRAQLYWPLLPTDHIDLVVLDMHQVKSIGELLDHISTLLKEQSEVVLLVEELLPFAFGVMQADVETAQDAFEAAEGQSLDELPLRLSAVVVELHPAVYHVEELFLSVEKGLVKFVVRFVDIVSEEESSK